MRQKTKRLAVVIGNSQYEKLPCLENPINDAKAIQKVLDSLGFTVTCKTDLTRNDIMDCFNNDFLYSWKNEASEIVVYYSGHGCSIDGEMYLIPTDANISLPAKHSFLELDIIIKVLLQNRNDSMAIIIILDCCRSELKCNVPSYFEEHRLETFKGEIGTNVNIAILYSTAEGKVALDEYDQSGHSLYTYILKENMEKDWTIEEIHREITRKLKDNRKPGGVQVPWIYLSLCFPYKFNRQFPSDKIDNRFYGLPAENHDFIDRPGIFSAIEAAFSGDNSSLGCKILALSGLGGMGKTQLMLRYCYVHRIKYDFIFWLEIDGMIMALDSFRNLAINLGIGVETAKSKQHDSIIECCSWLQDRTKWLLLLDNADVETLNDIFEFLPRVGGDIIITTREPVHPTKTEIIHVKEMNKDEALSLLYGQDSMDRESAKFKQAQEIVDELDSIPLAINLARAYVHSRQTSFKDYLNTFKNQRRDILFSHYDKDNVHQYKHSLETVWKISIDRAQAEAPAAELILNACAFLQSELIPRILFERQYSVLKRTSFSKSKGREDSGEIARAIAVLVEFSLLSKNNEHEDPAYNTFTIHRLIQKFIYEAINKQQKIRWVLNLATAFNEEIYEVDNTDHYKPAAQTIMNTCIPHIRYFSTLLNDIGEDAFYSEDLQNLLVKAVTYLLDNGIYIGVEELAKISVTVSEITHGRLSNLTANSLDCLASFYSATGNYADAEANYVSALEIMVKLYGFEHLEVATFQNNLALLNIKQHKYANAKQLCQRALNICQKTVGHTDPRTATSLNSLANIYRTEGNFSVAENLLKRALEIRMEKLGPEDPETANSLNNMALLYQSWGKYDDVEQLYKKTLDISKSVLGHKHAHTAISLNNLALFFDSQGKYADAKQLHREALDIREHAFGPGHVDTAESLNNLGMVYFKLGRYDEAKPHYERALTIREKVLGPEHLETANSLDNLASLYHCQAKYVDAEQHFKRAQMIRGPGHQCTANSLNSLASLNQCQGRYADAESLYQQALAINKETLESVDTANSLNGLALLYKVQGKYADAQFLYEKALVIGEKELGPEHRVTATSLNDLASLYDSQRKYTSSKSLHQRALAIREKVLGSDHPDTATSLSGLGFSYHRQGKHSDTESLYQKALEIREKKLGPDHPVTAASLNDLASLYKDQHKYSDAESLYQRALEIREKILGPEHPATATSLNDLASLYKAQGKYDDAEPLYRRALDIKRKTLGSKHPETAECQRSLEKLKRRSRLNPKFIFKHHRTTIS